MAEEENKAPTEATEAAAVTSTETSSADSEKAAPHRKRPARASKGAATKAASKPAATRSKKGMDEGRLEKLRQVDAQLVEGTTLKDAVRSVGISDQTYYQWKKASKPDDLAAAPSVSEDDELAEFVRLDEENRRLRKLLAEKLRAENVDLRRRLGLG